MKILAIESASLTASAALLQGDTVTAEYTTNFKKTHSQTLLPMVDAICSMTGVRIAELDAIAVSEGPGSFTGLRIGAATAKGLAFASDIPIIPVPTLDAIAYGCYGSSYLLCPLMDARRSEVYSGLYEFEDGKFIVHEAACARSIEEQVSAAEKLAGSRGKQVLYLGDGLPVFREKIRILTEGRAVFAPAHICDQKASSVAALGAVLYEAGKMVSSYEFEPLYLRKSQAEQEREKAGLSTEPEI